MSLKPKVYVDIDNVVLDLQEGVRLVLLEQGISFYPEALIDYNYNGAIGCDKRLVFESFKNPEIYKRAPLFSGVEESLQVLRQYADVYAWTQITPLPELWKMREHLCKSLGLHPLIYAYPSEPKPIDSTVSAVFEDSIANLEKWRDTPTDLYLVQQPYNVRCFDRRFIKVFNLQDGINRFINRLFRE